MNTIIERLKKGSVTEYYVKGQLMHKCSSAWASRFEANGEPQGAVFSKLFVSPEIKAQEQAIHNIIDNMPCVVKMWHKVNYLKLIGTHKQTGDKQTRIRYKISEVYRSVTNNPTASWSSPLGHRHKIICAGIWSSFKKTDFIIKDLK